MKSIIKLAEAEGYSPDEFVTELLESVAALAMMELDKRNEESGKDDTDLTWTLICGEAGDYEIRIRQKPLDI